MDTRKKKGIAGRMVARWRTQLNFRSFFVTLVVALGLLVWGLLVWGLSLLGSAIMARRLILDSERQIMDNQARIFARSVEDYLEVSTQSVRRVAERFGPLYASGVPALRETAMRHLRSHNSEFFWLGFADASGVVRAGEEDVLVGTDISGSPAFREGRGGLYMEDMHVLRRLNQFAQARPGEHIPRVFSIAIPVLDARNTPVGVMIGLISEELMTGQIVRQLRDLRSDPTVEVALVSKSRQIQGGFRPFASIPPSAWPEPGRASARVELESGGETQTWLVSYAEAQGNTLLARLGWRVLAGATPLIAMLAASGALGVLILAAAAVWLASGALLKPMGMFVDAVRRMGHGERPQEITRWMPAEMKVLEKQLRELLIRMSIRETELSKAYADLAESFRGVSENFPGVLFRRSGAGGRLRYIYVSPSSEKYMGVAADKMLEDPRLVLPNVHPEDRHVLQNIPTLDAQSDGTREYTYRIKGNDGAWRWMRTYTTRRETGDGKDIWDGVTVDVTEIQEAEQQAAAARVDAEAARGGRGCEQGQGRLPCHDEPRDPHAAQRHHRFRPADRGERGRGRAQGERAAYPRDGRDAAQHPQRHPRLLQDRREQAASGNAADVDPRGAGAHAHGVQRAGAVQGAGLRDGLRAGSAAGDRRFAAPAPDRPQPAVQRDQVHLGGQGVAAGGGRAAGGRPAAGAL
ncbi:MAG: PAS domain-containing protein [Candidatus Protistobacter heckmanni]|nr:PAS domain-containing protein [Candidatus Protistobacter heckmanni]